MAALNKTGRSSFSSSVQACPVEAGGLPAEWRYAEIGQVESGYSGYAKVCGGSFVLAGVHTSFAGERDNVPYIYKEVEGDFVWVARLHGRRGPVSEAGLMVRAALDETAESVTMTLGHAGGRFARMGSRKQAGTERRFAVGNAYTWLPAWFKLTRAGDVFYAYESPDGCELVLCTFGEDKNAAEDICGADCLLPGRVKSRDKRSSTMWSCGKGSGVIAV